MKMAGLWKQAPALFEKGITEGVNRLLASPVSFGWMDHLIEQSREKIQYKLKQCIKHLPLAEMQDLHEIKKKASRLENNLSRLSRFVEQELEG